MSNEYLQSVGLGGESSIGALQEQLRRQEVMLGRLLNDRATGNVSGGQIVTGNAPNSIPIGPYRQDVDSTFSLQFTFWIPDYQLRIKRALVHLTPGPIRSSVVVASSSESTPSGGGSTSGGGGSQTSSSVSTPSGGGSTSGGGSHTHAILANSGAGSSGSEATHAHQEFDVGGATGAGASHVHSSGSLEFTGSAASEGTPGHTHSTPAHTHPSHTHDVVDHTHTTPAHTHPSHSHTLTLGIAESGLATAMHLYIDAIDRTTALGGPWSAEATLDITDYLVNIRREPVVGAHVIKVTSTAVGSIEVVGDLYGIIRAILA